MSKIDKFNDFNKGLTRYQLEIGEYYSRVYKDGSKTIFKFSGSIDNDYVKVSMCTDTFQEIFEEDSIITISKEGTGIGSYIIDATQEDIDFLDKRKEMYDNGYFDNLY